MKLINSVTLTLSVVLISLGINLGTSLGSFQSALAAKLPPDVKAYLTSNQTDGIPSSQEIKNFTCTDEVYLVVETGARESIEASDHQLSVFWHNPNGKVEQRTLYDFTLYQGGSRVWAWLRLSGPPGAAIARLFDPAFGMGKFIGTWRAVVKIDRKKIASLEFEVLC